MSGRERINLCQMVGQSHQTESVPITNHDVLSAAERYVFRLKTSGAAGSEAHLSGKTGGEFAETDMPPSIIQCGDEGILFLAYTAELVRKLKSHEKKNSIRLFSDRDANVQFFGRPICSLEFSRQARVYQSRIHIFDNGIAENSNVNADLVLKQFYRKFGRLLHQDLGKSGDIDDAVYMKRSSEIFTRTHRDFFQSETSGSFTSVTLNPVTAYLCRALAPHVDRYYSTVDPETVADGINTNSFLRGGINTWLDNLRRAAGVSRTESENGQVDEGRLEYLPYLDVFRLDQATSVVAVCTVTMADPWFIDERVPRDAALPTVAITFFDVGDRGLHAGRQVIGPMRSTLGVLSAKLVARNRGKALQTAAGEASLISQHWFSEGVPRLMEANEDAGGFSQQETERFWIRFVEELLCADVRGNYSTEVFPFDRAYIITKTAAGLEPSELLPSLRVIVLEAALESRQAADRFNYRTAIERGDLSIAGNYDPTKKIIVYKSAINFQKMPSADPLVSITVQDYDAGKSSASILQDEVHYKDSWKNVKASSLISADHIMNTFMEKVCKTNDFLAAQEPVRQKTDRSGLLFDYRSGMDFEVEAPLLFHINNTYLRYLKEKVLRLGGAPSRPSGATRTKEAEAKDDVGLSSANTKISSALKSDSKVVVLSFEPRLCQDNQRTKKNTPTSGPSSRDEALFLTSEEAVTIILVADKDDEKSIQDIASERDDLRLLFNTIVRQKLRDGRFQEFYLERRVEVVEALVNGLIHRFIGVITSASAKKEIQTQWAGLRKAIRMDRQSSEVLGPFDEPHHYLGALLSIKPNAASQEAVQREIEKTVHAISKSISNKKPVDVKFEALPLPPLLLEVPRASVRECFDVALKNAVEACVHPDAPDHANIRVFLSAFPRDNDNWMLEIVVENTSAPVPPDTWARLTANTPQPTDPSAAKPHSLGVGVYAARNLLQAGLGRGSDIRYVRGGPHRIQARVSLPAEMDQSNPDTSTEGSRRQSSKPTPDITSKPIDILYLEDDPAYREPSLSALQQRLPKLHCHAAASSTTADALLASGLPKLVISDITVPKENNGAARPEYGYAFIKKVLQTADSHKPAVWLVTGRDPEEVRENLDQIADPKAFGFEVSDGTQGDLTRPGIISVLSGVKNLATEEGLMAALACIAPSCAVAGAAPAQKAVVPDQSLKALERPVVVKACHIKEAPATIETVRHEHSDTACVISPPAGEAGEAIVEWFASPGVADSFGLRDDPQTLASAFFHQDIVLLAPTPLSIDSVRLRYFLLCHNVIVPPPQPDTILAAWARLINENRGPIARVRHDIRNIRREEVAAASIEVLEQITHDLEAYLRMPDACKSLANSFISTPTMEAWDALINSLEPETDRARFQELLQSLVTKLLSVRGMIEAGSGTVVALDLVIGSATALTDLLNGSGA